MAPSIANATMSISGYGTKEVVVESVAHGMSVVSSDEDARNHRAFYTNKVTSGSFDLGMAFTSHAAYQGWSHWMMEYLRRMANGALGPVRVKIPQFGFDKIGVPSTPIPFGDERRLIVYRVNMTFIGTSDPLNAADYSKSVSQFRNAGRDETIAPYFYPAGSQLSGDQAGKDYDWDKDFQTAVTELQNPKPFGDTPYAEDPNNPFNFTGTIVLTPPTLGEK